MGLVASFPARTRTPNAVPEPYPLPKQMGDDASLEAAGLDSLSLISLAQRLGARCGRPVSVESLQVRVRVGVRVRFRVMVGVGVRVRVGFRVRVRVGVRARVRVVGC